MSELVLLSEAQMRRRPGDGRDRVCNQERVTARDAPPGYGPRKTLYSRLVRWTQPGEADRAVNRRLGARNHYLRGIIVVGDGADLAFGRSCRDRLSTHLQKPRRGRQVERTCRTQCAILTQAVASDEVGLRRQPNTALLP